VEELPLQPSANSKPFGCARSLRFFAPPQDDN
jgi:hypothetical protein